MKASPSPTPVKRVKQPRIRMVPVTRQDIPTIDRILRYFNPVTGEIFRDNAADLAEEP